MSIPLTITQHWLTAARHVASPNCSDRPSGAVPSLLVIHNISLPPGRFGGPYIDDLFRNCLDPAADPYFETICTLRVSAHLLIRRGGELVQYVPFNRMAWHAGRSQYAGREACNEFSIGIELEGSDDQPFAEAQYTVLVAVTQALLASYPSLHRDHIVGHADIAPGRKTDPGPCFDWGRYRAAVAVGTA